MSRTTTDPKDPDIDRGPPDEVPVPQNKKYLVLSEEDRKKGFVKPLRTSYLHKECGTETTMGLAIAETYARDPNFYGATYCVYCQKHRPLKEFTWLPDGEEMDPSLQVQELQKDENFYSAHSYRKKPVVVEAFQMTRERRWDNSEWPEWLNYAWQKERDEIGSVVPYPGKEDLFVNVLEGGSVPIPFGSWIIRGLKGELYPCDPEIFCETYEKV